VLRGTGTRHQGAELASELANGLSKLESLDGIFVHSPDANVVVLLRDPREIDQAIEIVGRSLRDRGASDRVVIEPPLKEASG
jgi:hypothetical protein